MHGFVPAVNLPSLFKSSCNSSARQLSSYFRASSGREQAHSHLNILSIINRTEDVTLCLASLTPPARQHGVGGKFPAGFCSAHVPWCLCSYSPSAQGAALCSLRGLICICLCWIISCSTRIQHRGNLQFLCSSFGKLKWLETTSLWKAEVVTGSCAV